MVVFFQCRVAAFGGWLLIVCLTGATSQAASQQVESSHPTGEVQPRAVPAGSQSAQQAKPARSELDKSLLDELDNDLLKGLENLPPLQPAIPDPTAPRKDDLDPAAAADQPAAIEHPLLEISNQMQTVQTLLAGRDTSATTQQMQSDIIARLAQLIDQAQQISQSSDDRQQSSGAGGGANQGGEAAASDPNATTQESTQRLGQSDDAQAADPDVQRLMAQFWGQLPDRVREQMQSAADVQFLPEYRELIEEYYKRLAETRRNQP